jgi:hypothetical protein
MELCQEVSILFKAIAKEVYKLIITRSMKLIPVLEYSFY